MAERGINKHAYALITGASLGIGRAFALHLAQKQHPLFLVSLPESGLPSLQKHIIQTFAVSGHILEIDLSEHHAADQVSHYCIEHGLEINLLINNAGIGYVGPYEKLETEWASKLVMLNIHALSRLTHRLIPSLEKNVPSFILNVGSLASVNPVPYKTLYSASKAFVYFFSRGLRKELKNKDILVHVLMPGSVPTNESTKKRIKAGGLKAYLSVCSADKIAALTIKRMLKGKATTIPGYFNQLVVLFQKLLPENLRIHLSAGIFKNQKII
jgi:short-subunit dehydrogenase